MGTSHVPPRFWLLKLHYLLQCKKYPEGEEECLIHGVSASSCSVFFPVYGKRLIISDLPIQYFFLLLSRLTALSITTSPSEDSGEALCNCLIPSQYSDMK